MADSSTKTTESRGLERKKSKNTDQMPATSRKTPYSKPKKNGGVRKKREKYNFADTFPADDEQYIFDNCIMCPGCQNYIVPRGTALERYFERVGFHGRGSFATQASDKSDAMCYDCEEEAANKSDSDY